MLFFFLFMMMMMVVMLLLVYLFSAVSIVVWIEVDLLTDLFYELRTRPTEEPLED